MNIYFHLGDIDNYIHSIETDFLPIQVGHKISLNVDVDVEKWDKNPIPYTEFIITEIQHDVSSSYRDRFYDHVSVFVELKRIEG